MYIDKKIDLSNLWISGSINMKRNQELLATERLFSKKFHNFGKKSKHMVFGQKIVIFFKNKSLIAKGFLALFFKNTVNIFALPVKKATLF